MNAIISAPELASGLAGTNPPVVLDVRWQLSVAKAAGEPPFDGRAEYAAGHIPSAVYVDLDQELASAPGAHGRHPLPDVARFGAVMRHAGVSADRPVVVYDGGRGWAAARAWWLLRWTGHPDVRVLDGGLPSWEGSLETTAPTPAEGDFTPEPGAVELLDAAWSRRPRPHRSPVRRPRGGALPGRGRAHRPGRRPHPGRPVRTDHRERGPGRPLPPGRATGHPLQVPWRYGGFGRRRVLRLRRLGRPRGACACGGRDSGRALRRFLVGVVLGPGAPGRRGPRSPVALA